MPTVKAREIRRIVDNIYRAIVEQRILPGTRLVEAKLTEALDANRNHVRSALQELKHRKVVTIEANRGAYVSRPSMKEARDVFEVRKVLEGCAIEKAAENITAVDIKRLKKLANEEHKAIAAKNHPLSIAISGRFHKQIVKISCNQLILELMDDLLARTSLIIGVYERKGTGTTCHFDDHDKLIELLAAKNPQACRKFMVDHLEHLEQSLALDNHHQWSQDFTEIFQDMGSWQN
ncbi:GntR family transcriptional regulator [Pelagibaculum spongiae]|uniref:HTH gntR-type domain-containing protein n=1 Tax=Pelagibaculum spongiae TaxID=2080658 RepID=A0A2V1GR80_9GAMM|nr:GntR family transcriptional regulator [Pelagibaculum spongiae]PVZ67588.1 hypothetical protein DC094_14205 [Pelagibaculum spongiae]